MAKSVKAAKAMALEFMRDSEKTGSLSYNLLLTQKQIGLASLPQSRRPEEGAGVL